MKKYVVSTETDNDALFRSIDALNPAKLRSIGPFNKGSKAQNNISYSENTGEPDK